MELFSSCHIVSLLLVDVQIRREPPFIGGEEGVL
jgi:hypothetical protein